MTRYSVLYHTKVGSSTSTIECRAVTNALAMLSRVTKGANMNPVSNTLDDLSKQLEERTRESGSVAHTIKDATVHSVKNLSDQVVDVSNQARDKVNDTVSQSREVLSSTLKDAANTVKAASKNLESPLLSSLSPYAERAGRFLDTSAEYLNNVTPQHLIRDTRTLAQKNPALFIGGAFVLGLVASRFLKSTAESNGA